MERPGLYLTINSIRVNLKQPSTSEVTYDKEEQDMIGLACMKLFQKVSARAKMMSDKSNFSKRIILYGNWVKRSTGLK